MVSPGVPTPGLQVRLLGPLEVAVGEHGLDLGGRKQRAVLALLALRIGLPVHPGQLITTIWTDPPPSAANMIQVYVHRLRKALMTDGRASPLVMSGGSYRLDLPPDSVDVHRFERLAARGRTQLAAGDAAGAADTLRGALSVWRGTPLPDLADLAEGQSVIAGLESLRTAVLADRIDADAALGRHAALVPELERLVLLHPLDERLVGQLMAALYRMGRQADALAAFSAAAHRLDDELGVRPGPDLRRTQEQVLRQDLADPAVRDPAERVPAAHARPGRHDPDRSEPDPKPGQGRNLLVGRTDELASVLGLLARPDVRLVTVLGPGGAGKTSLAKEIVARNDAAVMVELAAVQREDDVLPEICRVLQAQPDWSGEPPIDTAARALEGAVLVLDNLEQLAAAGSVVEALLGRTVQLKILTTSRIPLGVPGEELFGLGPLPVPAAGTAQAVEALGADAVRLFRDRVRRVLPDFDVTDANAAAVSQLCRRLDGLPLALELAAARTRLLPPAEILNRLDRRLDVLASGAGEVEHRHRSMWAAIDWSVRMLAADELRVFAQFSVTVGGGTLSAAESICAGESFGGISADDPVLDVVQRLVDRSLLVADGSGRIVMLETIRDYAVDLLAKAPELRQAARRRHARYYTALAEELGPQSHPVLTGDAARQLLEQDTANLGAALEFAHEQAPAGSPGGSPGETTEGEELLGRMVSSMVDHWYAVGRVALADRWVGVALEARLPPEARVRLLLSLGNLATARGDLAPALTALREARAAAAALGQVALIVRSSAALAVATRYGGDPSSALTFLAEARAAAGGLGVASLDRALAIEEGEVLDELGRTDEAVELWEQVLAGAAADEDLVQQAFAQIDLARVHLERGELEPAEAHVAEAHDCAAAAGQPAVLSDVLAARALVELAAGRAPAAALQLTGAIRLAFESGQLLALTELTAALGAARLAEGDVRVAARLLGAGAAWQERRGVRPGNRLVRAAIARAAAILVEHPDRRLAGERARGARVRFGSLRALAALDPKLLPG